MHRSAIEIRRQLEGAAEERSHGRQIRDYLYSVDAADALVTLLESDVEGAVNIASGEPSTIAQLVYRAAAQLGRAQEELDLYQGNVIDAGTGEVLLSLERLVRSLHFGQKHEIVTTADYYEPPSVPQDAGFKG